MIGKIASIVAALCAAASFGELHNPQVYWRMCDASAAISLDHEHFVAADDEGNTLLVYKRGTPDSVRSYDLAKFLLTKKKAESDLEGAARVGDRIYWISSHGRDRKGKAAPDRQRFFATKVYGSPGLTLDPIGKPYRGLLRDLLAEQRFARFGFAAASLLAPKDKGGLNIEGLTARPDGTLLIAFRNPVPAGKALLVPLLNPDKVIEGARAQFGDVIELNLDGSGVRDLTLVGDKYLVIAGARDGTRKFGLFLWNGRDGNPQKLAGNHFEKLNPEAIFRFQNDAPNIFQILSDDGSRKFAGKECKDYPVGERNFRAGELLLELPQP